MTDLELYKFVTKNKLEWHYADGEVILFLPFYLLAEFATATLSFWEDDPRRVVMRPDSIALDMGEVCDHYGLNMEEIFPLDEKWDQ